MLTLHCPARVLMTPLPPLLAPEQATVKADETDLTVPISHAIHAACTAKLKLFGHACATTPEVVSSHMLANQRTLAITHHSHAHAVLTVSGLQHRSCAPFAVRNLIALAKFEGAAMRPP